MAYLKSLVLMSLLSGSIAVSAQQQRVGLFQNTADSYLSYAFSGSDFRSEGFIISPQEVTTGILIILKVYPNPAYNDITVSADVELAVVTIYNADRQKMLEEFPHHHEVNIDVSQFPRGIYLIQAITNEGEMATQKVIVGTRQLN